MMKIKIFIIVLFLLSLCPNIFNQSRFRSGTFLHHSTGQVFWGNILEEIPLYNLSKGYTDSNAVSLGENWFPGGNNDWVDWHNIFDFSDPNDIQPFLQNNKIIIIKSCFPSSLMEGVGSPNDTLNDPYLKSIYNYKWHWRSIINIMRQHPENFFVIWTNAPLVPNATNLQQAAEADQFCTWAKDTLATGNDPIFGVFPSNVYVFDFFNKLTDDNGMMRLEYASSPDDSHPNAIAAELIAPQFVQEIFDAAIAYEEALIPVELTLFNGNYEDGVVNLKWITATETNNFGFEVERRDDFTPYEKIGFVNGNGTTTNRVTYNFADKNISSNRYYYRLKQIDMDGTFEYSNEIQIDINNLNNYQLFQNYPNPFNPSTEIEYVIPKSEKITLKVYNSLGSEVATLVDGFINAGKHLIKFNSKNLTSGIYFYRMKTDNIIVTRKMLLIK